MLSLVVSDGTSWHPHDRPGHKLYMRPGHATPQKQPLTGCLLRTGRYSTATNVLVTQPHTPHTCISTRLLYCSP